MFSLRLKIYALILLFIILVGVAAGIWFWPKKMPLFTDWHDNAGQIKIAKYLDLNKIPLPDNLRAYLLSKEGSGLNVIYFDGQKLIAHDSFDGDYFSVLYLNAMRTLAESPQYTLLPGYYLISFLDGVHDAYAWPVLGFAGTKQLVANSQVVLLPDPDVMQGYRQNFTAIDNNLENYAWDKKIAKVFWRGAANGIKHDSTDINGSPRLKFLNKTANFKFVDVGLTGYAFLINDQFMQKLQDTFPLKEAMAPEESIRYKYLIDIDGKSCSWSRMAWILYSNSVLLKHQSDKIQWYYDRLKPYVHYIPIAEDFSDLARQYDWLESHQTEAMAIATNGREIAKDIFSDEGVMRALEQSLLAYNSVINNKLEY